VTYQVVGEAGTATFQQVSEADELQAEAHRLLQL
jgi:hypothetical protein